MKNLKMMAAIAALPVMMAMSAPSFAGNGGGGFDWCDIFPFLEGCQKPTLPDRDSPVSVPEPATLALLGAGLAAAGIARRKKK